MSLIKRRQAMATRDQILTCILQKRFFTDDSRKRIIPTSTTLSIGDVRVPVPDYVLHPERVVWAMPGVDDTLDFLSADKPLKENRAVENMFFSVRDARTRRYLRWMCQKELLGQDMCLIGDPGPALRWLVQLYSCITRREIRVIHLNRDITESDLKQRREIRNGTLVYEDQGAVTAAKEGQLLVLDGIERAERNVLPVINNLLENREMHLDNGSSLIHPQRYDKLVQEMIQAGTCTTTSEAELELQRLGLIRVSEHFRVIGITIPVPPYEGNPLDPPLRSRFQCLYVSTPPTGVPSLPWVKTSEKSKNRLEQVLQLQAAIRSINDSTKDFQGPNSALANKENAMQYIGNYEMGVLGKILALFPDAPIGDILTTNYPWPLFALQAANSTTSSPTGAQEMYLKQVEKYLSVLRASSITAPLLSEHSQASLLGATRLKRFIDSGDLLHHSTIDDRIEKEGNYIQTIAADKCVPLLKEEIGGLMVNIGRAVVAACGTEKGGAGDETIDIPVILGNQTPLTPGGQKELNVPQSLPQRKCIFTPAHYHLLQAALQLHIAGENILLIGPTGCGKTALIQEFASLLGYEAETTHLYADMTNKDLFQRRTTDAQTGNTTWENAALVDGAINGRLVVLDGIDKLSSGMLSSLQQLLIDRNAVLFDGTILKSLREYEALKEKMTIFDENSGTAISVPTDQDMRRQKIYPIHPAFRVIATARPSSNESSSELKAHAFSVSHEVTTLFSVVAMPEAKEETLRPVLLQVANQELASLGMLTRTQQKKAAVMVDRLLKLRGLFEDVRRSEDPKVPQLTLRQLLHLVRVGVHFPNDLPLNVASSILLPLMTGVTATLVNHALEKCSLKNSMHSEKMESEVLSATDSDGVCFEIQGKTVLRIPRKYTAEELTLVPFVTAFFPNRIHESIICWLAKQYSLSSNILLIGTQGVGKNKVVDTFLSRIRVPRHYLQLHRDTTVGSLTINPSVQDGKLCWEDSPLVKAVQKGHCLVIDEIDKASVEVVQILKGLIEDREMRLGDGRRVIDAETAARLPKDDLAAGNVIVIHPDFRVIVLANPPGFPFHGNDFFRECGDLFASYVMENPDRESQLHVLRSYGSQIPQDVLERLIAVFQKLQESFHQGNITYPFSLRELIAVVRHLSRFPQDGVYQAMNNVFNFDARDESTITLVRRIMHHYFHPLASHGMQKLLPLRVGKPTALTPLPTIVELPMKDHAPPSEGNLDMASHDFSAVLPLHVLHTEESLRTHLQRAERPEVPSWVEHFAESSFSPPPPTNTAPAGGAFTEWANTVRLPFIDPSTDTVVSVRPIDFDDDHGDGVANLVSVFFSRRGLGEGNVRYILATVRLPPLSVDDTLPSSSSSDLLVNDHWRTGEARLVDVSSLLAHTPAEAITLHQLGLQSHAGLWRTGELHWPRTVHAQQRQGVLPRGLRFPPVLVLRCADAGGEVVYLVDVSLGGVSAEHVAPLSMDSPVAERADPPTRSAPALQSSWTVQPLDLQALIGGPAKVLDAHPRGTLSLGSHNTVHVLKDGTLLTITLPAAEVLSFRFVTDTLAVATLKLPTTGATQKAVVKLARTEGQVGEHVASIIYIPKGVEGTLVDVDVSKGPAQRSLTGGARLAPEDLVGSVWSPNRPDSPVAYMLLDGFKDGKGQFYVYPSATKDADAPSTESEVDIRRHQLVQHSVQAGGFNITNVRENTVRTLSPPPLPQLDASLKSPGATMFTVQENRGVAYAYTASAPGMLSMADVDLPRVQQRYANWSSLLRGSVDDVGKAEGGADGEEEGEDDKFEMKYSTPRKQPSGTLKHGEIDNEEHHGGNTWAGGTGGTDTAGLGGLIGPYRLDKGNPVHQVSPRDKQKVPPHLIAEAKRMGKEALKERLKEIGMSETEYDRYKMFHDRVEASVVQLRTLLKGLRAAEGERVWVKGQTDGVWDDKKIVEGIVGEKNVFKRRVDSKDANPFQQRNKKRVLFVLDVSASMYRFEGYDQRLTKLLESTIMVMEAFAGFEQKIDYCMIGHNGDSECIPLVDFGAPPANQKERMVVCQKMVAYAQYCWSGDNTVEAMEKSIELVTAEKGDAYFVFVISDANLRQYGITPSQLTEIIKRRRDVQMFCIFIASLGAQASQLQKQLPAGHGYECMRTDILPQVLRQIFTSVNLL